MSLIDLNFLKQNFNDEKIVFFDIGCSDLWDTKDFVKVLPNATFYAFEPLKEYYDINIDRAKEYGVNFFNYAVSDVDGEVLFYPSEKEGNNSQLQSSSIFKRKPNNNITYGEPYIVKSVTIETFCEEHKVSPNFIHIDVEGAEYSVFKKLGNHRTYAIWTEMIAFRYYEIGRDIDVFKYEIDYELDTLLKNYGYQPHTTIGNNNDSLYVHKNNRI